MRERALAARVVICSASGCREASTDVLAPSFANDRHDDPLYAANGPTTRRCAKKPHFEGGCSIAAHRLMSSGNRRACVAARNATRLRLQV